MHRRALLHFFSRLGLMLLPHAEPYLKRWSRLGFILFLICFVVMIFTALTGCALLGTSTPELNPKIYYKHDMIVHINGKRMEGVGVAPRADSYQVTIEALADMHMLQITTCQRDDTVMNAITSGWFKPRRGYTFTFTPTDVEKDPACPLKLAGYDKSTGKHSWAYVEFEHPSTVAPAGVACNGITSRSEGTFICQSLEGLIQKIWFERPVRIAEAVISDKCRIPVPASGNHWTFKIPNRECIYIFEEITTGKRSKLITVGYEAVPVRGE